MEECVHHDMREGEAKRRSWGMKKDTCVREKRRTFLATRDVDVDGKRRGQNLEL